MEKWSILDEKTMESKVLCPSLPDLLRKTVLTFCEGSVKFERCLEVVGSLHIRSDNERIATFIVDEQMLRVGDSSEGEKYQHIQHVDQIEATETTAEEERNQPQQPFVVPKKSRKISRPMKKSYMSQSFESSDAESEFDTFGLTDGNNAFRADNIPAYSQTLYGHSGPKYSSKEVVLEEQNIQDDATHTMAHPTPVLEVTSTKPDYTPPRLESRSSSAQETSDRSMECTDPFMSPPILERETVTPVSLHSVETSQYSTVISSRDAVTSQSQHGEVSSQSILSETSIPSAPVKVERIQEIYPVPQISPSALISDTPNYTKTASVDLQSRVIVPVSPPLQTLPSQAMSNFMGGIPPHLLSQFPGGLYPALTLPPPMQTLYPGNLNVQQYQYACSQLQILKDMLPRENNQLDLKQNMKDKTMPIQAQNKSTEIQKSPSWEKNVTCPVCSKKLKSHRMLQLHMNSAHTHKLVYPCKQCNKVFYARSSLHSHTKRAHTPAEQRLKCPYCIRDYAFQSELNRHVELAHGRSMFDLATVAVAQAQTHAQQQQLQQQQLQQQQMQQLQQQQQQQQHEQQKEEGRPVEEGTTTNHSSASETKTASTENTEQHINEGESQESFDDSEQKMTEITVKTQNDTNTDQDHSIQINSDGTQVGIETEGHFPQDNQVVNAEVLNVSPDTASGSASFSFYKFRCHICGTVLKSKECLALHINAKHTQKHAYPCKICGKIFYAPSSRFCHMKRVHTATENKFKCMYCWKVFTFHYELRKHMKVMHRGKLMSKAEELADSSENQI